MGQIKDGIVRLLTMDAVQDELFRQTGEMPRAVVTDNNEPRQRGRVGLEEEKQRVLGEAIRHRLTVKLAANDLKRPMHHDMHYNRHGNIHMSS